MIDADVDFKSKHLKGRLWPRVRDVTFFAPKEVGWGPEVLLQKSLISVVEPI